MRCGLNRTRHSGSVNPHSLAGTGEQELASVSDDECTAIVRDGEPPANPLFTPPCDCPRCAPEMIYDRSTGQQWLRLGRGRQRYRVEVVELGAIGKAGLG